MNANGTEVKEKLNQLAEDTRSLLAATANLAEEAVVQARNGLKSAWDGAEDRLAQAKTKAARRVKVADRGIRENPYQAVGIALGIGALAGLLLSRRGRD